VLEGACYYPAGSLWLYRIWYNIYSYTNYGEYILKTAHIVASALNYIIITKLCRAYFKNRQDVVQLIAFALFTNHKMRMYERLLVND